MSARNVLVTGGTRGIGAAITARFAREGDRVWYTGRSEDSVRQAGESFAAQGLDCQGLVCDVADFAAVGAAIAAIDAEAGALEVLVNNAGITQDMLLMRMSEAQWDQVQDVNLKGCFNTLRHAVKGMMRARKGSVINLTSVVAHTGNPGQVNYTAAKAGVIGLTLSAAKELAARGIRVNAVAPGYIETDMTAAIAEKAREAMVSGIPLARPGQGVDVAEAVFFLAGEKAAYITGQVLNVDGGLAIHS